MQTMELIEKKSVRKTDAVELWDLLHELAPFVPSCNPELHNRVQEALDAGASEDPSLIQQVERLQLLNKRALGIIANAIVHGMPITQEVADVRNQIVQN